MISDDFHALAREVESFMIKISKAAEGGICWRLLKSTGWYVHGLFGTFGFFIDFMPPSGSASRHGR